MYSFQKTLPNSKFDEISFRKSREDVTGRKLRWTRRDVYPRLLASFAFYKFSVKPDFINFFGTIPRTTGKYWEISVMCLSLNKDSSLYLGFP